MPRLIFEKRPITSLLNDIDRKYYEKDHGFHKDFPLYSTRPWELKAFGQGIMLYFYFLKYMAWQFGMMAIICGFPNMAIFLLGPWYNTGLNTLEVTTIGNYGLVSNSTLGAGNLTQLFGANPVTAANPEFLSLSSGVNFGNLGGSGQLGVPMEVQRELDTLQLFRLDANMTPSTIAGFNKRNTINAMALLDLVTCIFYFGFTLFFIVQTRRLSLKADLGNCTIEDYSIRVQNVPKDVTKEELTEHFEQFGEIHEVVRAREVWDLVFLARKKRQCFDKHEYAVAALQKAAMDMPTVPETLETEVLQSEYDLALVRHAMKVKRMEFKHEHVNNIVEAFVVFEDVESKARALKFYPPQSSLTKLFKRIFRIGLIDPRNLRNGTWPIEVIEGPEPSDIIWENLQIKNFERAFFFTVSWMLKALLLLIGFMATSIAPALKYSFGKWPGGPPVSDCNSYCSYTADSGQPVLNTSIANFYSSCHKSQNVTLCGNQTICYECFCRLTLLSADYSQAFYCSPWASILGIFAGSTALSVIAIVAVNYCLPYAIEWFSTLERHHTITATHRSSARALVFMFFLNTAVSIMVANAYLPNVRRALDGTAAGDYLLLGIYPDLTPNWFKTVGEALLLAQWIGIFSRMAIILYYYVERWYFLLPSSKKAYLTQRQLNKAYNGPEFTLDEKYGMHTAVIFVTLFLGGTLPLSYAISCISFITIYWLEKHFLLKFCRRPVPYSDMLSRLISELLPWAAFYHLAFAAWSFSMIAVPESGMVTPFIKWILGSICWGLNPLWQNTNGLTGDQMTTRLAQANAFPLLIFLFILAASLALFSFVDRLSWFFGPLFFRILRRLKQLVLIRHVNRIFDEHVLKKVALAANTVQQGVSKVVEGAVNQVTREKSERSIRREEEKLRDMQRDEEEAILDAAVEAALEARQEADEMKFQALLAEDDKVKGSKASMALMRGVAGVVDSLDPKDVEGSKMSTKSESKFKPTAKGLLEMPLFSDAINPSTPGWKLEGPKTYHIQEAPLYQEIFDDSMDHMDHEESAKEIERLLQGRDIVVSRKRRLLRSKAAEIALKATTPRQQLKSFGSKLGSLRALGSVMKREEDLKERASAHREKGGKLASVNSQSLKLTTLPDQDMTMIPRSSLPMDDVGPEFKRVATPTRVDENGGGKEAELRTERPGSRARSKLSSREGRGEGDAALVGSPPPTSLPFVETVVEEEEEEA